MATQYSVLYDSVLSKIKDFDLAPLTEDEVYEVLHDYIRPAVVKYTSARCGRLDRDDSQSSFINDLTDDEIEILSGYMVLEFCDAEFMRNSTILKQSLPNKDIRNYAPQSLLNRLGELHDRTRIDVERLMNKYSYRDSPLYEIAKGVRQ